MLGLRMRAIGKGEIDWGSAMGLRVRRSEQGGMRSWVSGRRRRAEGLRLMLVVRLCSHKVRSEASRGICRPCRFDLEKRACRATLRI
jgi:hypothetical protein